MPEKAKSELAPTGTLRVGVNLGNFLLVNKDAASGVLRGVSPTSRRNSRAGWGRAWN